MVNKTYFALQANTGDTWCAEWFMAENVQDLVSSNYRKNLYILIWPKQVKLSFGVCKIRQGWLCAFMHEYKAKYRTAITFSTNQLYLRDIPELSPIHSLCFQAVTLSYHVTFSPTAALVPFAHGFLSFDCVAPLPCVFGACMLLNIEWSDKIILPHSIIWIMRMFLMSARNVTTNTFYLALDNWQAMESSSTTEKISHCSYAAWMTSRLVMEVQMPCCA